MVLLYFNILLLLNRNDFFLIFGEAADLENQGKIQKKWEFFIIL